MQTHQSYYNYKTSKPEHMTFWGHICYAFLRLFGWRTLNTLPREPEYQRRFVVIQAPHTSNWDFFWGKIWNYTIPVLPQVLMKKELFVWPLSILLRAVGAIPLDRKNRRISKADLLIEEFNKNKEFTIAITPEGTRSRNPNWRKGFYKIAEAANVPVVLGVIDYTKRELGTFGVYYLTGNFEEDFRNIRRLYKQFGAKYPENFSVGDDLENE